MDDISKLTNLSFIQIINNLKTLKAHYSLLLSPFFNAKEIRIWKNTIYSLPYPEWKLNLIWEVLNDDISIKEVRQIFKLEN